MQHVFELECWRDGAKGVERTSSRIVQYDRLLEAYNEAADCMVYATKVTGFDHWAEFHPIGCNRLTNHYLRPKMGCGTVTFASADPICFIQTPGKF